MDYLLFLPVVNVLVWFLHLLLMDHGHYTVWVTQTCGDKQKYVCMGQYGPLLPVETYSSTYGTVWASITCGDIQRYVWDGMGLYYQWRHTAVCMGRYGSLKPVETYSSMYGTVWTPVQHPCNRNVKAGLNITTYSTQVHNHIER